ncbi:MAG: nucleotidyl transferase AbiEii/AbiGii toxin family protein [Thermoplasmatales archaeon]|nr:nucleotidyl transferase AbiEii/AbiGii toxin family protein [Thermoplasmatales archaeon]
MIDRPTANRFANVMGVDLHLAQQEIVLLYALGCFAERGIADRLVFKGGTYARMMVTGDVGRLSEDLDFTNAGLPEDPETLLAATIAEPFHGVTFRVVEPYRTRQRNWACGVSYEHPWDSGLFRLEISYREATFLPPRRWRPIEQGYFSALEFRAPELPSLCREEAIAEKVRAIQQRATERDLYDAVRYGAKGFDERLVRLLAVGKMWNDRQPFEPERVLASLRQGRREWPDLERLIGRARRQDWNRLCAKAAARFAFLRELTPFEQRVNADCRRHALRDELPERIRALGAT